MQQFDEHYKKSLQQTGAEQNRVCGRRCGGGVVLNIGGRWNVRGRIGGRWEEDYQNWWDIVPQNRWEMGGCPRKQVGSGNL